MYTYYAILRLKIALNFTKIFKWFWLTDVRREKVYDFIIKFLNDGSRGAVVALLILDPIKFAEVLHFYCYKSRLYLGKIQMIKRFYILANIVFLLSFFSFFEWTQKNELNTYWKLMRRSELCWNKHLLGVWFFSLWTTFRILHFCFHLFCSFGFSHFYQVS